MGRIPTMTMIVAPAAVAWATVAVPAARSPEDEGRRAKLLFRVGDGTMTVGEMEDGVADPRLPAVVRAGYADPAKLKDEFDRRLRHATLAAEARRTGMAERFDVVLEIRKLMRGLVLYHEVAAKVGEATVADQDVRAYYETHSELYNRPEMVQAGHILLIDRAAADAALGRALAARGSRADLTKLVRELSEDAETKRRGGTLGTFDKQGRANRTVRGSQPPEPTIAPEILAAAFTMNDPWDVHPALVATRQGFHIVFLQNRLPPIERSLEEVGGRIRRQLLDERREQERARFVDEARARYEIVVRDAAFDHVVLLPGETMPPHPHGLPDPGMGLDIDPHEGHDHGPHGHGPHGRGPQVILPPPAPPAAP